MEKTVRVREYTRSRGKVRKHKRRKPERTIEYLQKTKNKPRTVAEIEQEYKRRNYTTEGLGAPHGADKQFFRQHKNDEKQDHARIYEKEKYIEVEEHTDLVSPLKDPAGHIVRDVGEVTYAREFEGRNENDTKRVRIKKKMS